MRRARIVRVDVSYMSSMCIIVVCVCSCLYFHIGIVWAPVFTPRSFFRYRTRVVGEPAGVAKECHKGVFSPLQFFCGARRFRRLPCQTDSVLYQDKNNSTSECVSGHQLDLVPQSHSVLNSVKYRVPITAKITGFLISCNFNLRLRVYFEKDPTLRRVRPTEMRLEGCSENKSLQ